MRLQKRQKRTNPLKKNVQHNSPLRELFGDNKHLDQRQKKTLRIKLSMMP